MARTHTVVKELRDLHKQATEERSHYYTGSVILKAIDRINRLESALSHAMEMVVRDDGCDECREIMKLLGRRVDET